ncbi:hypothetical protein CEXT_284751 [Caerostris extrusa]|uniref:Uncharacterized protein n=1 Tax=Caerostris extrusa TaxID=172846 RepID=A0AAV4QA92_CAEEX|nr:hypothetical protein CEXT_284751 [Caerostris extrusa]
MSAENQRGRMVNKVQCGVSVLKTIPSLSAFLRATKTGVTTGNLSRSVDHEGASFVSRSSRASHLLEN